MSSPGVARLLACGLFVALPPGAAHPDDARATDTAAAGARPPERRDRQLRALKAALEAEELAWRRSRDAHALVSRVEDLEGAIRGPISRGSEARERVVHLSRELAHGTKAVRALSDAASSAVRAIYENGLADDGAVQAMLAYAFSRGLDRQERARAADEAATLRTGHTQNVIARLQAVASLERSWRSASESALADRAAYWRALTEIDDEFGSIQDQIVSLPQPDTRDEIGRHLAEAVRKTAGTVARAHAVVLRLSANVHACTGASCLAVPPGADLGAVAVGLYAAAERDRQLSVQARAYWNVAHHACTDESECEARTAREEALADAEVASANAERDLRRKHALEVPAALLRVAEAWTGAYDVSRTYEARSRDLAPVLAQLEATATRTTDLARNRADAEERRYRSARAASDAAYLAVYGAARKGPEVYEVATGSAIRRDADASTSRVVTITVHAYAPVTRDILDTLPAYGAYTYVLFSQRPNAASASVRARYQALLTAIVSTTGHLERIRQFEPETLNVFCIPTKLSESQSEDEYRLESYDAGLSLALLATAGNGALLNAEIMQRFRHSPGPFLLTTFEPLEKAKTMSSLLFADLSGYAPESYTALVARYKEQLIQRPPSAQESMQTSALQWAFARGAIVYDDTTKVASRVAALFNEWFAGTSGKTALLADERATVVVEPVVKP